MSPYMDTDQACLVWRVPASIFEVNADVVKDLDRAHILVPKTHPCPKVPAVVKVSSSIHVVRNLNTTDTLVAKIFHAQHKVGPRHVPKVLHLAKDPRPGRRPTGNQPGDTLTHQSATCLIRSRDYLWPQVQSDESRIGAAVGLNKHFLRVIRCTRSLS